MQVAARYSAEVLPGNRIEVATPDIAEGTQVEVIVLAPVGTATNGAVGQSRTVLQFLDALPSRTRTEAEWDALEAELRTEKAAWDR